MKNKTLSSILMINYSHETQARFTDQVLMTKVGNLQPLDDNCGLAP